MNNYGDYDSNIYRDKILYLLSGFYVEYCICYPSTFQMIEYYNLKTQSWDTDDPTYL